MSTNDTEKEKLLADIKECCRRISYFLSLDLDTRESTVGDPLILRDNEYNYLTTLSIVEVSNLGSDFTRLAKLLETANEHK